MRRPSTPSLRRSYPTHTGDVAGSRWALKRDPMCLYGQTACSGSTHADRGTRHASDAIRAATVQCRRVTPLRRGNREVTASRRRSLVLVLLLLIVALVAVVVLVTVFNPFGPSTDDRSPVNLATPIDMANGMANQSAVVRLGDVRIEVLSPALLRLEYSHLRQLRRQPHRQRHRPPDVGAEVQRACVRRLADAADQRGHTPLQGRIGPLHRGQHLRALCRRRSRRHGASRVGVGMPLWPDLPGGRRRARRRGVAQLAAERVPEQRWLRECPRAPRCPCHVERPGRTGGTGGVGRALLQRDQTCRRPPAHDRPGG